MSMRLLLSPVVAAALMAGGCAPDGLAGPEPEPQRELTPAEHAVADATSAFGIRLLQAVRGTDGPANVMLSPLSASMALGLAWAGADGATRDAMRDVLELGDGDDQQILAAYGGLFAQLRGRDERVEIGLANSIWYERSFDVHAEFLDRTGQHFRAAVSPLDFSDAGAPARINAWVAQETNDRIREVVERIDPLDRLILVNAVYFRAPWTQPFEEHSTQPAAFTTADGRTVQVPMMMQDAAFRTFRNETAFGAELLYADSAFSMVVVAPADGHDIDGLVDGLSPQRLNGWIEAMETGRVMLRMPRYRLEYGTALRPALEALGMGVAFVPRTADFSRMAASPDLHISAVRQNTFLDVHELGTEAAAATAVTMSITSLPPQITFDRPFIAAIRHRESGTLLFLGVIGDPAA